MGDLVRISLVAKFRVIIWNKQMYIKVFKATNISKLSHKQTITLPIR